MAKDQDIRLDLANAAGVDPSQITSQQIAAAKLAQNENLGGVVPSWLQPTVRGAEQLFVGPPSLYGGSNKAPTSNAGTVSGGSATLEDPAQEKAWIKAGKAKKASAKAQAEALAQRKQEALQIQNSPWTQAANALANAFTSDLTAVAPDISGASIPGAQQSAASQAAGDLGLASQSPGAAWLNQGAANAQAQTQGVAGAMAAEGQTYANADASIANAVRQWGEGNALDIQTAPADTWLGAAQSHILSTLSYQGWIPNAAIPSIPNPVLQVLKKSGGYPGSSGSGLTALQNITEGPRGTAKVSNAAANALTGTPGVATSVPAAGVNAAS